MVTHSSTLAWTIPTVEEPGRLQSMASQRVGHNLVIYYIYILYIYIIYVCVYLYIYSVFILYIYSVLSIQSGNSFPPTTYKRNFF